ncbi:MAG: calcium-binding protein [Jannaschia sp.]
MTLSIRNTDSITVGVNTSISGVGDSLYLLPGVLLASTTSAAIVVTAEEVSLQIDGIVLAEDRGISAVVGTARVTVGAQGSVVSMNSASAEVGILLDNGGNILVNRGQITAPEAVAVFLRGGNNEAFNSGSISGSTGVQLSTGVSDELINHGDILGTGSFDGVIEAFEGRGVLVQGSEASVYNGIGGFIGSTAPGGTGVLAGSGATGTRIENLGEIAATDGIGIDFSPMGGFFGGNLSNSGIVSGKFTAVEGGNGIDVVVNSGVFVGDVVLNGGDDAYRASGDGIVLRGGVFGDDGNDTLRGGESSDVFSGGADNDLLSGGGGSDSLDGGSGNDLLMGGFGDDRLDGGDGTDTLTGGDGEDDLRGGTGSDLMKGGAGDDTLDGEDGLDTLRGGSGDDLLVGGRGRDVLFGGSGDDTLISGRDQDMLTGGDGKDVFVFTSTFDTGMDSKRDIITDFERGKDLIDLSEIGSGLTFSASGVLGGGQASVFATVTGGGIRVRIDRDGDGIVDGQLQLEGLTGFAANDLIL